jgi:hypothetical protein
MKARLIIYDLSKLEQYNKIMINRALFGYTNNSNNNQYHYRVKGLLNKVHSFRFPSSAVIILEKDQKKVISILKKNKARYKIYPISIKRSMLS